MLLMALDGRLISKINLGGIISGDLFIMDYLTEKSKGLAANKRKRNLLTNVPQFDYAYHRNL